MNALKASAATIGPAISACRAGADPKRMTLRERNARVRACDWYHEQTALPKWQEEEHRRSREPNQQIQRTCTHSTITSGTRGLENRHHATGQCRPRIRELHSHICCFAASLVRMSSRAVRRPGEQGTGDGGCEVGLARSPEDAPPTQPRGLSSLNFCVAACGASQPCPAGTYSWRFGTSKCLPCPIGTYSLPDDTMFADLVPMCPARVCVVFVCSRSHCVIGWLSYSWGVVG